MDAAVKSLKASKVIEFLRLHGCLVVAPQSIDHLLKLYDSGFHEGRLVVIEHRDKEFNHLKGHPKKNKWLKHHKATIQQLPTLAGYKWKHRYALVVFHPSYHSLSTETMLQAVEVVKQITTPGGRVLYQQLEDRSLPEEVSLVFNATSPFFYRFEKLTVQIFASQGFSGSCYAANSRGPDTYARYNFTRIEEQTQTDLTATQDTAIQKVKYFTRIGVLSKQE